MGYVENNGWITDENGTRRVNPLEKYSYLIGTKVNKWEVLSIEHTRRQPDAICKCGCGTIKAVNIRNLINNMSKDCGCGRKIRLSKKERICGNETIVVASSLTSHHTLSCGCLNSYYNSYIDKYLCSINIAHQSEYSVKINGRQYRFDFYLPDYNMFIEYDGSQHYEPTRYYGGNIEKNNEMLLETKRRDKIKNTYCKENNINLLRIPYWESKNIKTIISNHLQRLNEKGSNIEYAIV